MANEYTTFTVGVGTLKIYTGTTWSVEDSLVSYLSIGGVEQTDLPTHINNYIGFFSTTATAKEYIITEDNTEVKIKGFFSLRGSTLPISNVTLQSELPTTWNMFMDCTGLTSINKFNFKFIKNDADRPNITSAAGMFSGCANLTTLDLSNWNTSNVTNMACMFQDCERLTTLDLSNWDTSNVTDTRYMLYNCDNLNTVYIDYTKLINTNVTPSRTYTETELGWGGTFYMCDM